MTVDSCNHSSLSNPCLPLPSVGEKRGSPKAPLRRFIVFDVGVEGVDLVDRLWFLLGDRDRARSLIVAIHLSARFLSVILF